MKTKKSKKTEKQAQVEPYGNRILVKRIEEDYSKTEGGIYLSKAAQEDERRGQKASRGIVLAVDTFEKDQRPLKPKQAILFNHVLAKPLGDEKYIVEVSNVMATLKV